MYPRDLPVAGRAVLARAARRHRPPRAADLGGRADTGERLDAAESERLQVREIEPTDGAGEVAERITAGVTVCGRIGRLADADAVEDEDHRTPDHAASR
jgi:hypothetical protein